MMNYLRIIIVLVALTPFALNAQNMYIDGTGGNALVFVDDNDGVNPTLYVEGGIQLDQTGANTALLQAQNNGNITVATQGLNTGDVVNNAGMIVLQPGTEIEVAGDFDNQGNLMADAASRFEFNGGVQQEYTHNPLYDIDNRDFGILQVNTTEILANDTIYVTNGGQVDFSGTNPGRVINVNTNNHAVVMDFGATFNNHYMGVGGPGAFTERYVNGLIRQVMSTATSYDFPTGTPASAQPYQINFSGGSPNTQIGYLDVSFDNTLCPAVNPTSGQNCGASTFNGYSGRWNFDAFQFGGTPVLDIDPLRYGVEMHPHGFTATGPTYVVMIAHDPASGDVDNGQWHAVVSNTSTPQGFPCIVPSGPYQLDTPDDILRYFSEGGGGESPNPLPVEMLPLTAQGKSSYIEVNWETISEVNASHFELERSTDLQNFTTIANNIPTVGGENEGESYSFDDNDAQYNVTYYYRLKQVDLDGSVAYSNVAEAMITDGASNEVDVALYPNPAQNSLNLRVFTGQEQDVVIRFYDATGKLVYDDVRTVDAGASNLDLSSFVNHAAIGTYNAVVNVGGEVFTTKLVKSN